MAGPKSEAEYYAPEDADAIELRVQQAMERVAANKATAGDRDLIATHGGIVPVLRQRGHLRDIRKSQEESSKRYLEEINK